MSTEQNKPRQYVPGDVLVDWVVDDLRWLAQLVIANGGVSDGSRILRQLDKGGPLSRTAVRVAFDNSVDAHSLSAEEKERVGRTLHNIEELARPHPSGGRLLSTKPRPGRPALPVDQKRRPSITVHVTDDELERIRQQAGEEPVSEYLRRLALSSGNVID